MKISTLVMIVGVAAAAAFVSFKFTESSAPQFDPAELRQTGEPPAASVGLAAQISNEGQVEVTVTPGDLSGDSKTWDFTVSLNTHSVELGEEMAKAAFLDDGGGAWRAPIAWNGDPSGGHHREGVLSFGPMNPRPATITLEIRGVGGVPVRTFSWKISSM